MVLGKLPVPGRPTILITVGQGPTALAVGAGGGLDIFTLTYPFSPLSPSLWETARYRRYRLKYCLKGPLNPKQPTNQPNLCFWPRFIVALFVLYVILALWPPVLQSSCPLCSGWSGGAMVLGKSSSAGTSNNSDNSRAMGLLHLQ